MNTIDLDAIIDNSDKVIGDSDQSGTEILTFYRKDLKTFVKSIIHQALVLASESAKTIDGKRRLDGTLEAGVRVVDKQSILAVLDMIKT